MLLEVVERGDGITQVALVGRLDIAGVHEIDVRFHAQTAAAAQPAIVDLGRLEYVASLGIGMLVSCAQSLQQRGCALVLAGATGDVDAALRRSGLDRALAMVPDVAAAERALSA